METSSTTEVQPLPGKDIPLNRFNVIGQTLNVTTNMSDRSLNNIMLTLYTPYGSSREIMLNDFVLKQYQWTDSCEAMESVMGLQDVICRTAFYYKKMNATSYNLGKNVLVDIPCCVYLDECEGVYTKEYYLSYEKCIRLFTLILKAMSFGIYNYNVYNFGK